MSATRQYLDKYRLPGRYFFHRATIQAAITDDGLCQLVKRYLPGVEFRSGWIIGKG